MAGRAITVVITYNGIKYSRAVYSEVISILDRFMEEVGIAAQELRQDIISDAKKKKKK